jgi:integrase
MTSWHWAPPILFLALSLLCTGLRVAPTRPASPPELPRWSRLEVEREAGLLRVRRAGGGARDHRVPASARLLFGLRLDLNQATELELQRLPRIGPVLSRRIIEARTSRGGFCSLGELAGVRGIGAATLRRLEPLLSVGGCAGAGRR